MARYYETYRNYDDDFLEHHGILGMKWGIRNYQYKDGSLTPAGRERYGVGKRMAKAIHTMRANQKKKRLRKNRAKNLKKARKIQAKKRSEEAAKKKAQEQHSKELRSKNLSDDARLLLQNTSGMSDQELANAVNRLRNEATLRQLAQAEAAEEAKSKGPSGYDKFSTGMHRAADIVNTVGPAIVQAKRTTDALGLTGGDNSYQKEMKDLDRQLKRLNVQSNLQSYKSALADYEAKQRANETKQLYDDYYIKNYLANNKEMDANTKQLLQDVGIIQKKKKK